MQAARQLAHLRNYGRWTQVVFSTSIRRLASVARASNQTQVNAPLLHDGMRGSLWKGCAYSNRFMSSNLEELSVDHIYADENRDPAEFFLREDVQKLLKSMTNYDLKKVFRRPYGKDPEAPKYQFMTDEEVIMAREMARERAKERLEMPPILRPSSDETKVHAYDPEIQGFLDSNLVFVDVSQGYSDKTRLMVVREPNGILRDANREERYRANQSLYPQRDRFASIPPIFEGQNFQDVLDRGDIIYMLDRISLQFEPDDPKYLELTCKVYEFLRKTRQFDKILSTRYFGPMAFYFAYHSKIDELLMFFLHTRNISGARDLVKLYTILTQKDSLPQLENDLDMVKYYIENHAIHRFNLEKSLNEYLRSTEEGEAQDAASN